MRVRVRVRVRVRERERERERVRVRVRVRVCLSEMGRGGILILPGWLRCRVTGCTVVLTG